MTTIFKTYNIYTIFLAMLVVARSVARPADEVPTPSAGMNKR